MDTLYANQFSRCIHKEMAGRFAQCASAYAKGSAAPILLTARSSA